MENRNGKVLVLKANDPEKIIVFRAASLQDEIRFYLNNTQYVTAMENEDGGIEVDFQEETDKKEKNKKTGFKDAFKLLLMPLLFLEVLIFLMFIVLKAINNILIYLIIMNTMLFLWSIINVVILESQSTSPSIKSKHSAEHMMVNFIEKNKRLPKNMEELRKTSRFSEECGSKKIIQGLAEDFISGLVATIIAVIANGIYLIFFDVGIIELVFFIVVYYLIKFIIGKLLKENEKAKIIIEPLKRLLTNIA